ncbi:MAG: PqqD family protein [Gammaproteobacteria bacterium]
MALRTYGVNAPLVATEKLDKEVMVVHLAKGNYYSLTGTGAAIWDLLTSGCSETAIASAMAETYTGDPVAIQQSIERFVSELCAEELLVVSDLAATDVAQPQALPADGDRPNFAAPQLEKYTDMQELLLIDPIHEVNDDHGWPKMKP